MWNWLHRRRLRRKLQEARSERREQNQLVAALLALENTRLEQQVRLDQARAELELKRVQWECENAESLQKAKEADARLREEIRERRRNAAAANRDIRAKKREERKNEASNGTGECRVCKGNANDLTTAEITWHYNGHSYGPSLFPNNG